MRLPGWYVNKLKEEIRRLKEMLEPLESGKIHLGEKNVGRPDTDRTQAQIGALKRSIAELQSIADGSHA